MVRLIEPLQRRQERQANDVDRLDPNGVWPGRGALISPRVDVASPAYEWDLSDSRGY
jgi:hypothetical protein